MDDHAGPGQYAHDALFSLSCPDETHADRIRDAVGREVGEIDDDRSRATLVEDGDTVGIAVDARDLSALRAATGTWLGLLEAADETVAVAERLAGSEDSGDGGDGDESDDGDHGHDAEGDR